MDLTTKYLGLTLRNPIIASASPLTGDVATIRQLEDAGAAAVVLPSLFEEQIRAEERLTEALIDVGAESSPEAGSYFPASIAYNAGPSGYLDLIARARAAVDIPVIASLNGSTEAGCRVGGGVTAPTPHRPGRADFPHPVLQGRD